MIAVRPALHKDAPSIVRVIMHTQGAHVSRRGTIPMVERMLNAAKRRDDYCVWVAERAGEVAGFMSAVHMMRQNLWEDSWIWQIEHLIGRNVLKPLLSELRRIAGATPVWIPVWWQDHPRAGALNAVLSRMGFTEVGAILAQEVTP